MGLCLLKSRFIYGSLAVRSCEDEEFLSFLLITSREMQSHGPIENYLKRIIQLYIVLDFRCHFRMSPV